MSDLWELIRQSEEPLNLRARCHSAGRRFLRRIRLALLRRRVQRYVKLNDKIRMLLPGRFDRASWSLSPRWVPQFSIVDSVIFSTGLGKIEVDQRELDSLIDEARIAVYGGLTSDSRIPIFLPKDSPRKSEKQSDTIQSRRLHSTSH